MFVLRILGVSNDLGMDGVSTSDFLEQYGNRRGSGSSRLYRLGALGMSLFKVSRSHERLTTVCIISHRVSDSFWKLLLISQSNCLHPILQTRANCCARVYGDIRVTLIMPGRSSCGQPSF